MFDMAQVNVGTDDVCMYICGPYLHWEVCTGSGGLTHVFQ